ncbi:hypothetical protein [Flavisphingomonas formosensis]|uniref:hypothetical protein n=1 Tax=Flavisphingomonas formosensis TaxID=861534 RepID=UPI0012FAF0D2|nr:hypothetical protein [Sphingomonas formosensis]
MIALLTAAAAILSLQASEVRRLPAPDAEQGVASDGRYLYAVSNRVIAKLDAKSGRQVARWEGDAAHFKHMNSCTAEAGTLICAASNYPDVPMQSRIERFDARRLTHLSTQHLGHGHGSLTWAMRHDGSWWACFANYDNRGGEPGRDHRFTTLVRYDEDWREQAQWRFPDTVLDRMAPKSASGGVWGEDGLLYVTGHDRPELYVLRAPPGGGTLELVAIVAIPTEGQAIAWDARDARLLWSIERKTRELVASRIPPIEGR